MFFLYSTILRVNVIEKIDISVLLFCTFSVTLQSVHYILNVLLHCIDCTCVLEYINKETKLI